MNILRAIMLGLDDESAWRAGLHERLLHIDATANARHRASIAALTNLQLKVNIMSDTQASLDTAIATLVSDNVVLKAAVESAPAAIATLARKALYDNLGQDEVLALRVDAAIRATRKDGWRGNLMKERELKRAVRQALGSAFTDETALSELMELIRNQAEY